jgi:hypothetical protein
METILVCFLEIQSIFLQKKKEFTIIASVSNNSVQSFLF